MVGGGNRRDEGSFKMTNDNVFAALDNLRKKKKSDKDKGSGKSSKSALKTGAGKSKEPEEKPHVFWAPAPLTVKSWADVDDEDDDDYYATTAPPQSVWGGSGLNQTEETMQKPDPVEIFHGNSSLNWALPRFHSIHLRLARTQKEKAFPILEDEARMARVFLSLEDKAGSYGYFREVNKRSSVSLGKEWEVGMESESDDDLLDEADDVEDEDEEHEHEQKVQDKPDAIPIKPPEASPAPKEAERQLSKKERKKKEMAELEAILANFGVTPKEKPLDESSEVSEEKKDGQLNSETEKKVSVPAESKSAKKKKKKDKASKEVKEPQEQLGSSQEESAGTEQAEDDASAVDMKERLKKMASAKKKKSSKELDAAARAASVEASARSAKLAAAKKKEKNHYNQQPTR
ncbi:Uncharacterized protein Adt_10559 [Abeliophyllum distichum]|uniref:Uncharacterized protein n=1 Tax=Abeliophyllum distichum TaxID=126358 RepID=A0ABD1UKJ7_9LAMI